ncbi:hypothetical protein CDAR_390341 [Caerostris darwini]|uniref:Uncharacterized protein n=1 Tax=Caerostris darwini TaxID=1538125 RepID=A0AAV4NXJ2_9ARAC|nr:hypothetical protein CDAR_390341 [Caerostris darwini]
MACVYASNHLYRKSEIQKAVNISSLNAFLVHTSTKLSNSPQNQEDTVIREMDTYVSNVKSQSYECEMQKGVKTSVHRRGSSTRVVHKAGGSRRIPELLCRRSAGGGKCCAHVRGTSLSQWIRWFESVDERKAKVETPFPVRVLVFSSLPIGRESILTCLDTYSRSIPPQDTRHPRHPPPLLSVDEYKTSQPSRNRSFPRGEDEDCCISSDVKPPSSLCVSAADPTREVVFRRGFRPTGSTGLVGRLFETELKTKKASKASECDKYDSECEFRRSSLLCASIRREKAEVESEHTRLSKCLVSRLPHPTPFQDGSCTCRASRVDVLLSYSASRQRGTPWRARPPPPTHC